MGNQSTTRLVKPRARGQITIPAEFRDQLGIDENTILQMRLRGTKIEITRLRVADDDRLLREYDAAGIQAFLEEDKLDHRMAEKARELLSG